MKTLNAGLFRTRGNPVTYSRANVQGQRSVGSDNKSGNKRTDGRRRLHYTTSPSLMRSVKKPNTSHTVEGLALSVWDRPTCIVVHQKTQSERHRHITRKKLPSIARPTSLTFRPPPATVMTYSHAKFQGQRSVGSEDRVETSGGTDGRTEVSALPPTLMRSVNIECE